MSEQDGTVFIQNLSVRGGRINAVQGGDQYNYIYRSAPPYRVEPYPLDAGTVPPGLRRVPSRLLTARHRLVPFAPRPELDLLEAWRDDATPGLTVRLLHGEGGQGKTRLAAEFAARSAGAGWTVAQARHRSEVASAGGGDETLTVRAPGLVIVVDYAERWPLSDLITLIRQHGAAARDRLRVLLLSRPAGDWWQDLAHQLSKLDILDADTVHLPGLPEHPEARGTVYTAARDAFAAALGLADPAGVRVSAELGDPAFDLMLAVHMKALVDVDAAVRGVTPPSGRDLAALSTYLLDREHDHWRSGHDGGRGPVRTGPWEMRRAVYVATLTPPLTADAAAAALTRSAAAEAADAAQVLRDHARCYPPQTALTLFESLSPDRLAEDFLALTLPGREDRYGYHATDPWAGAAPAMLLEHPRDGQPPPYARQVLTVLVETARRWPHVVDRHLVPMLLHRPALARAAGGATLSRLCDLDGLPDAVLESVAPHLPQERHVDLDLGVAAVTRRIVRHRIGTRDLGPAEQAGLLSHLAWRYGNAGLLREAADAAREAVALRRRTAADDTAALSALADDLNGLAAHLTTAGRYDEAAEPLREAVDAYRTRAAADRAEHAPALAMALNNLGVHLLRTGRPAEAAEYAAEAVELLRPPAAGDPGTHLPTLATALTNLSNALSRCGRLDEGVRAVREALELHRRLAGADRMRYLPDLAMTLLDGGQWLMAADRSAQAREATEEAVRLYRELADANPAAHLPHLAMAWDNLGNVLARLERPEDALEATRKGLEIRERLTAADPERHRADRARSLTNLSIRLSQLARPHDGLAPAKQAVELWRPIAAAGPVHLPDHATALHALDHWLTREGRHEEALDAAEELLAVRRRLAEADASQTSALATALHSVGARLAGADRRERAMAHLTEAVGLRRGLARTGTAADASALLDSVNLLGTLLVGTGRAPEAVRMSAGALLTLEEPARTDPDSYRPHLATAATLVGIRLSEAGRPEHAVQSLDMALLMLRRLAEADSAYLPQFANVLRILALVRVGAGIELEPALQASTEAVRIARGISEHLPPESPLLADALTAHSLVLEALGGDAPAGAAPAEDA
ncbi:tetratricopeptide repeat protein [Streptomyces misionensis]|uniref:Tetratricopeptide repeat protein n=1 Tax=Streptomyces misionensis TaxID=67331 RepID=A0A5C6JZQ7_9ACTN|nr:tetratricopeptide repeat protein [Streptomyces misionensis]TWV56357.1 tetratricopeptide repeat protein [Streptomyces misionensis]